MPHRVLNVPKDGMIEGFHAALMARGSVADPDQQAAAARLQRFYDDQVCFDEFHVADIADAMILGRLMQALFKAGVIFCITSNYPPGGLYPNGLQRERLLPTIALLNDKLDVIRIDAGFDYRLRALTQADVYLLPSAGDAATLLMRTFAQMVHGEGHARPIEVLGRTIPVLRRAPGVAWFDFAVLCGGPRSQNDYLDIAHRFHTLFLSGVSRMGPELANEARRFTWLVDVCHDHRVKLVIAAAVPADELYIAGPQATEFARTVSRLVEMRSHEYLASAHRRHGATCAVLSEPTFQLRHCG